VKVKVSGHLALLVNTFLWHPQLSCSRFALLTNTTAEKFFNRASVRLPGSLLNLLIKGFYSNCNTPDMAELELAVLHKRPHSGLRIAPQFPFQFATDRDPCLRIRPRHLNP
jgi:hypothetical protein